MKTMTGSRTRPGFCKTGVTTLAAKSDYEKVKMTAVPYVTGSPKHLLSTP